jgi:hypothetical protein
MSVARVGLDLAESVFQVHGVDAAGQAMVRRQLARSQLLGFLFHAAADPRNVLSARPVRMKLRSTSQNSSVAENIGLCPLPSKR